MNWYIAIGNEQKGPFPAEQLVSLGLKPETLVWREGMVEWQPARQVADLQPLLGGAGGASVPPPPPPAVPMVQTYPQGPGYMGAPAFDQGDVSSKRVAAGVCGIVVGGLGVHKFVLGLTTPGVIMLLVTLLTCGFGGIIMGVVGLVEGIIYLTKSDQEFYEQYIVGKKGWF